MSKTFKNPLFKAEVPAKWRGAFSMYYPKRLREHIDDSLAIQLFNKIVDSGFMDQESISALEYMVQFNHEYYQDYYKADKKPLHNTPELKKSTGRASNSRRRDAFSYAERIEDSDSLTDEDTSSGSH